MAAKNKKRSNGIQAQPATASTSPPVAPNESPLELFGQAKDRINVIFEKLDKSVVRVLEFYSGDKLDQEVVSDADTNRLKKLNKSVETIKSVLSRNQMKVAFFGRTSNGKSTVINAILHDKVLPMGYGHTTGCFLQIQGSQNADAFLEVQKKGEANEKRPIQSVTHIANALNSGALEHSTLVKIYWPVDKCSLLKYDVVLVDSPGVDVEEDLDQWIDEHCHDADVFVLVCNAESTLNIAEKHFFHKVSEKLSKPNIFILNNRWDSIADDPDSMEQVRRQHTERSVQFLSDEIKITTPDEAKQKTFFVSARETLRSRCGGEVIETGMKEGYSDRSEEFKLFERCFEESLSKSAVKTKFQKHTDKGRETIQELNNLLNTTQSLVKQVYDRKQVEFNQILSRTESIVSLFYSNEQALKGQITEIKRNIQIISDSEFETEIRRLSRIVEDFEEEFSPNLELLKAYKESLYLHVETSLSDNLKNRIVSVVSKQVKPFNKIMCDMGRLLSEERLRKIESAVEAQSLIQDDLFDFKVYKQFYTEFQEDLEFRFSLGLVSIIRKFQSKFSSSKPNSVNCSSDKVHETSLSSNTDFLAILERFMMNPPQSPTTVGSLAVGGILVRTLGWKVIIVTTVVYGALYAYEYLTWTNSAKENAFKAQYVRYARKGLQGCAPIISQHISNSVERKLMATFSMVKREIDEESDELRNRTNYLRISVEKLERFDQFSRQLLGENHILMNELVHFATSYFGL